MKNIEKSSLKLIEAKSLTKKFGNFIATDNIDFEIGNGEIFGFLGPNGAGKSTTFKMLCGLLTPTLGTAKVLGEDLYKSNSNISNVIVEIARAAKLGMDAQTNLIKVANESRYGDDGVKGVINMITEQNPSINGELAVKLQQVIESERTRYKNSQSKMLDIKRSYLTLLQSMPSSHFLKGFPKIDLKQFDVITNDYTQKAYSSGKSEAVEF
jgi:ABC-type cobalamin/Fe3+-siderophores transport system ATPase subunit